MASARVCCREPMITSTPALAQRRAIPGPCSPVPPKMLTITRSLPLLTEQITLRSPYQLCQAPFAAWILIAADDGHWHIIELIHHQFSRRSQFVGNGQRRDAQLIPLCIKLAGIILDRLDTRETDRNVDQAMPPGASKGIGDNHRHIESEALTQSLSNRPCRRIGVGREHSHHLFAFDIRLIYAGISANKTVMRFGNEDPTVHFDDAARLLQHNLDMARIFPPLLREIFS